MSPACASMCAEGQHADAEQRAAAATMHASAGAGGSTRLRGWRPCHYTQHMVLQTPAGSRCAPAGRCLLLLLRRRRCARHTGGPQVLLQLELLLLLLLQLLLLLLPLLLQRSSSSCSSAQLHGHRRRARAWSAPTLLAPQQERARPLCEFPAPGSPSRTGPLTFRIMWRSFSLSSRNLTRTWVTCSSRCVGRRPRSRMQQVRSPLQAVLCRRGSSCPSSPGRASRCAP